MGEIFPFGTTTDIGLANPAATGEAIVWDYGFLEAELYDADTFLTVEETPLTYQFFFNNQLLYPDHRADYAVSEEALSTDVIDVQDPFSYYKTTTAQHSRVGAGANINGLPASIRNLPVDVLYEFPLEIGDSYDGFTTQELDLPMIGYYYSEQTRTTTVEGYGTLLLPGGESFEVLKLQVITQSTDSLYNAIAEVGFEIEQLPVTRYQWLSQEHGRPVLEITETAQGVLAQYFAMDPALGVNELRLPEVTVFPNPSMDRVNVSGEGLALLDVRLLDVLGRPCHIEVQKSEGNLSVDLSALLDGYYTLELSDGKNRWTRGVIKNGQ